jgi:rod shape-determining protein MreC
LNRDTRHPLFTAARTANVRLVVFVLASVATMTADHRYGYLEVVRDSLSTLIYPLQYAINLPTQAIDHFSDYFHNHRELLEENAGLRRKHFLMSAQSQKLAALEAENRRLRLLLQSSVNIPERALIAEVLSVDLDPYRHRILLNKGRHHGVRTGQPLIDQRGILGQIIHAGPLSSTAILITDPNHALPVQINRNGLRTLAMGIGNFQELELRHIPNNADVKVGDLLVTSGLGGRFPRGYPVAVVTKVEFDPATPFARILAEPSAQLDRSREVLVIQNAPEPRATTQPPAEPTREP